MILIHASDGPAGRAEHVNYDGPVKWLFTTQRTSKAFQAAISKCKLLQQRMFLAPYQAETTELLLKAPVFWLQSCMEAAGTHQLDARDCMCNATRTDIFHVSLRLLEPGLEPSRERPASWLSEKASWRKMRIHCKEGEINRVWVKLLVSGEYFHWPGTEPTQLGPLYDWLERIMVFEVRFEEQKIRQGLAEYDHGDDDFFDERWDYDSIKMENRAAELEEWRAGAIERLAGKLAGELGLINDEDGVSSVGGTLSDADAEDLCAYTGAPSIDEDEDEYLSEGSQ